MTLMGEIQALRAEIEAHGRRIPSQDGNDGAATDEPSQTVAHDLHGTEAFLKEVSETLDEFADELDRFPRLTALVALGVGLAVGVVIGRQRR